MEQYKELDCKTKVGMLKSIEYLATKSGFYVRYTETGKVLLMRGLNVAAEVDLKTNTYREDENELDTRPTKRNKYGGCW